MQVLGKDNNIIIWINNLIHEQYYTGMDTVGCGWVGK